MGNSKGVNQISPRSKDGFIEVLMGRLRPNYASNQYPIVKQFVLYDTLLIVTETRSAFVAETRNQKERFNSITKLGEWAYNIIAPYPRENYYHHEEL